MQTRSSSEISSLPQLLWSSFRGTLGTVVGVMGFLCGVGAWFIPASVSVPLSIYVITLLIACAAIVTLLEATRIARLHMASPLPKVVQSVETGAHPRSMVLLLTSSPLFGFGMIVSIFVLEHDSYERFIAEGIVQNVQDDGLIQVRITEADSDAASTLDAIRQQQSTTLTRLRVKPYKQQISI